LGRSPSRGQHLAGVGLARSSRVFAAAQTTKNSSGYAQAPLDPKVFFARSVAALADPKLGLLATVDVEHDAQPVADVAKRQLSSPVSFGVVSAARAGNEVVARLIGANRHQAAFCFCSAFRRLCSALRRFAAIVALRRRMFARHSAIHSACRFSRSASSRSLLAASQAAPHAGRPLPGGVQFSQ
jgi:hypothetical protein